VSNSGPGYQKNPDHKVTLEREGRRVQVRFAGEIIADSRDVITMHETNHGPVFYVPRADVTMDRLVPTAHHTYCPYKGQASYFTLAGARTAENAVWSYETPYDEVGAIKERLAFYPDRVDEIIAVPEAS
jgi:uncharacterized protein (DUF427 family)